MSADNGIYIYKTKTKGYAVCHATSLYEGQMTNEELDKLFDEQGKHFLDYRDALDCAKKEAKNCYILEHGIVDLERKALMKPEMHGENVMLYVSRKHDGTSTDPFSAQVWGILTLLPDDIWQLEGHHTKIRFTNDMVVSLEKHQTYIHVSIRL